MEHMEVEEEVDKDNLTHMHLIIILVKVGLVDNTEVEEAMEDVGGLIMMEKLL